MGKRYLREMANSDGTEEMTAVSVDALAALRAERVRYRDGLRDILCITQENLHEGCTCFSCTAYEIARKALEKR